MLLEVIVTSAADALAAVRGGASRLELVSAAEQGGLTPSVPVLRSVLAAVDVPVRVMLRAADDDALGTTEPLRENASRLHGAGAREFVCGGLTTSGEPDPAVAAVVPPGCPWTFHRALDATADLARSVRAALAMPGCDTVLVAGSPQGLDEGLPRLQGLLAGDVDRSRVLVGGGVRAEHLVGLVALDVRAVHLGRAVRAPATWDAPVDPSLVAAARSALVPGG